MLPAAGIHASATWSLKMRTAPALPVKVTPSCVPGEGGVAEEDDSRSIPRVWICITPGASVVQTGVRRAVLAREDGIEIILPRRAGDIHDGFGFARRR